MQGSENISESKIKNLIYFYIIFAFLHVIYERKYVKIKTAIWGVTNCKRRNSHKFVDFVAISYIFNNSFVVKHITFTILQFSCTFSRKF